MAKNDVKESAMYATISTVVAIAVLAVARYFLGKGLDPAEFIIIAVIFWITNFLIKKYFYKKT